MLLLLTWLLGYLLKHAALHHQLVLELRLLLLSKLWQFLYNVSSILKPECSYNFPGLAISLCLGNIIMLLSHMHVPGSIGGVFFSTVVKAGELLLEFFGASSNMLLPLSLSFAHLRSHHLVLNLEILYQTIYKFILLISEIVLSSVFHNFIFITVFFSIFVIMVILIILSQNFACWLISRRLLDFFLIRVAIWSILLALLVLRFIFISYQSGWVILYGILLTSGSSSRFQL